MPLNFGIPSLDELIEIPTVKAPLNFDETSIAILGPDGSGKSVLALHLASTYLAEARRLLLDPKFRLANPSDQDAADKLPLVIYISSDLRHASAKRVWKNFDLAHPTTRQVPFEKIWESIVRAGFSFGHSGVPWDIEVPLTAFDPGTSGAKAPKDNEIGHFLQHRTSVRDQEAKVAFLDLASHTAGDDWSFANSLIGQLESVPSPKISPETDGSSRDLKHLVIIDSVAGFETFVGKLDAHGEEQSRRARIAQCMRNAGSHCHVVFVVEEPIAEERLPEEYVTDVVVRLRVINSSTRIERTVEVEKARARQHAVGQHPFEIRGPQGTSTGNWENADTPIAKNSYVQVFPTLQHRYGVAAMASGPGTLDPSSHIAPFGLHYLDRLLSRGPRVDALQGAEDIFGVRGGTVTAILGDSSTGKSSLSEKLLAEGFRHLVQDWIGLYAGATDRTTREKKAFRDAYQNTVVRLESLIVGGRLEGKCRAAKDEQKSLAKLRELARNGLSSSGRELATIVAQRAERPIIGIEKQTLPDDYRERFARPAFREQVIKKLRPKLEPDATTRSRHGALLAAAHVPDEQELGGTMGPLQPEKAAELLTALFCHPNFRFPAVLLTTSDKKAIDVAQRCLLYLDDTVEATIAELWEPEQVPTEIRKRVCEHLVKLIEDQLIVRRLDIDTVSTAAFIHLIKSNISAAQEMVFGTLLPPRQIDRNRKSNRIRLVIDDFRVLCSMCGAMQRDTLFLPYLIFLLQREGVTSAIVHTDAVRPDRRPDDETSRTLLSLVNLGIFLWSVPFEGRSRIAMAVVPPSSAANNGVIRELTLARYKGKLEFPESRPGSQGGERNGSRPDQGKGEVPHSRRDLIPGVTPHFELYAGIEEGRPKLVPLAVYVFDEARRFKEYVQNEDALFRELFASYDDPNNPGSGQILFPLTAKRYEALRDFAHLPSDTQDGHSIVYQVDGYWSMGKDGSLNSVYAYLFEPLEQDEELARHQDPYRLFRNKPLVKARAKPRRIDFFQNEYFRSRLLEFPEPKPQDRFDEPAKPDRVPFMWDFAFTLARTGPWTLAAASPIRCTLGRDEKNPVHVQEVFRGLAESIDSNTPDWLKKHGWRYFFEACQIVATEFRKKTGTPVVPFDLAVPSGETINCLILEIWLSELESLQGGTKRWEEQKQLLSNADYDPEGVFAIEELLILGLKERTMVDAWKDAAKGKGSSMPTGYIALYKTWLLLLEALDFGSCFDSSDNFTLVASRECSAEAVASRHWYKTACDFSSRVQNETGVHDGVSLLRLPGRFSTRGDWFLASSAGSRSRLVGQYAIDLLSSRRANLTRMQMGLGLPVRDVLDGKGAEQLRTALQCEVNGTLRQVPYKDLVQRCGVGPNSPTTEFSWLWRSSFSDYDRQSRVLQKWMARIFQWTVRYRQEHPKYWEGGFDAYDRITNGDFEKLEKYSSAKEFAEHCDLLLHELSAARRQSL